MPIKLRHLLACVLCCLLSPLGQAGSTPEQIPAGSLTAEAIRYVFAIYYPAAPAKQPMATLREQLKAIADAPTLVASIPDKPTRAVLQPTLVDDVQKTYSPPDLDMVQRFGRGLTRDQAIALQTSRQVLVLDFAHPASMSVPAYRASLRVAEQLARDTKGLLWDEETREVFTTDEWRKSRLETWDGDTPNVLKHTIVHAYRSGELVRGITLGMAKFGLPDVVVSDFPWSSNRPIGNLVNLLTQAMAEGAVIKPRGTYDLDLRAIRHAAVRESHLPTLKPNSNGIAKLTLVKGTWESGDPRNRLVEIRFDRVPGPDAHARRDALLLSLFGTEDQVTRVNHTNELLAASKAAIAKLPALRDAFNRGLQPGEYILVKAPFEAPNGGREWMWVEVMSWSADSIRGLLKNEPKEIPNLHGGQVVTVSQSKVFDYIRRAASGAEEGNETGKVLQRMQDGRR